MVRNFIKKNFTEIVAILTITILITTCSIKNELSAIKKQQKAIRDSTYTKTELATQFKIMQLNAEKSMIQATDRTILDVNSQSVIDAELNKLTNGNN